MNREILFRGKRYDGKGWVYGTPFYVQDENKCFIIDNCQSLYLTQEDSVFKGKEVVYNSVGQFTGLTDKGGVNIFEGDIVKTTTDKHHMVIGWSKRFASYIIDRDGWAFSHWFGESMEAHEVKVIGNIHDNPELIK